MIIILYLQYDQLLVIRKSFPVPVIWQVSWLIHQHTVTAFPDHSSDFDIP